MRVAVLAITRNGVGIGSRLAAEFPHMEVYAPKKLAGGGEAIHWYEDSTTDMVGWLFAEYDALVCVFSLGAVIRLMAPHLRDKKTDPAVLVIDRQAQPRDKRPVRAHRGRKPARQGHSRQGRGQPLS